MVLQVPLHLAKVLQLKAALAERLHLHYKDKDRGRSKRMRNSLRS